MENTAKSPKAKPIFSLIPLKRIQTKKTERLNKNICKGVISVFVNRIKDQTDNQVNNKHVN